jgi:hypothetical protein
MGKGLVILAHIRLAIKHAKEKHSSLLEFNKMTLTIMTLTIMTLSIMDSMEKGVFV